MSLRELVLGWAVVDKSGKAHGIKPAAVSGSIAHLWVFGDEQSAIESLGWFNQAKGDDYESRQPFRVVPVKRVVEDRPQSLSDWCEGDGDVLWWRFPIVEPPYIGSPLDSDWPVYHTHWTPIPLPCDPPLTTKEEEDSNV